MSNNRIIKFRAWDKINNRMLDNVSTGTIEIWGDNNSERADSKNCEFMQFTGLRDKNGKEVYEGDVVTYDHIDCPTSVGKVEWNEQLAQFWIDNGSQSNRLFYTSEVIGNIYENPELLK